MNKYKAPSHFIKLFFTISSLPLIISCGQIPQESAQESVPVSEMFSVTASAPTIQVEWKSATIDTQLIEPASVGGRWKRQLKLKGVSDVGLWTVEKRHSPTDEWFSVGTLSDKGEWSDHYISQSSQYRIAKEVTSKVFAAVTDEIVDTPLLCRGFEGRHRIIKAHRVIFELPNLQDSFQQLNCTMDVKSHIVIINNSFKVRSHHQIGATAEFNQNELARLAEIQRTTSKEDLQYHLRFVADKLITKSGVKIDLRGDNGLAKKGFTQGFDGSDLVIISPSEVFIDVDVTGGIGAVFETRVEVPVDGLLDNHPAVQELVAKLKPKNPKFKEQFRQAYAALQAAGKIPKIMKVEIQQEVGKSGIDGRFLWIPVESTSQFTGFYDENLGA